MRSFIFTMPTTRDWSPTSGAGAGDDRHLVVETEISHVLLQVGRGGTLRFLIRLHVEAARQIDERNRLAAQREEPVDIGMRLRHRRDRRARDDLAHLGDIDTVVHLADAELDNLELVRSRFEKNSLLIS